MNKFGTKTAEIVGDVYVIFELIRNIDAWWNFVSYIDFCIKYDHFYMQQVCW